MLTRLNCWQTRIRQSNQNLINGVTEEEWQRRLTSSTIAATPTTSITAITITTATLTSIIVITTATTTETTIDRKSGGSELSLLRREDLVKLRAGLKEQLENVKCSKGGKKGGKGGLDQPRPTDRAHPGVGPAD